jgi:hypothetical protein
MDSISPEGLDHRPRQTSAALFNRRELLRAALLAGATSAFGPAFSFAQAISAGLTPAARGEDGAKLLTDPNWRPLFLNEQQNETLIALGDVIIPRTDSPGARDALVNRFLDLLVSVESDTFQQQFVSALAYIDAESRRQLGRDFRDLAGEDQVWLLTPWAYPRQTDFWMEKEEKPDPGQEHFARLKSLIADAYYGSEVGHKELGWDGEFTHGPYEGCQHVPKHT